MGLVLRLAYIFFFEPFSIRIENRLESKSLRSPGRLPRRWRYAQILWLVGEAILDSRGAPDYIPWVQNMIGLDIRLREIVQREDFLIEQCEKAEELLGDPKKRQQQLDQWHTEMRNLEQSYWSVERMLDANDLLCPIGPSWRAYLSLRKLPQWYLTPWLIEDCARRGGCCGRTCGFCSKPRSSFRSKGHGHCTKTCGCCLQTRGFPLDEEQAKLCQLTIDIKRGLSQVTEYDRGMLGAYTFGLVMPRKRIFAILE